MCLSCRSEGRTGVIGERPPFDDPRTTTGVCWTHKLEMLRKTRTTGGRGGPTSEAAVRFIVVVARHAADIYAQLRHDFTDDSRVQVVLDRRRSERRWPSMPRQPERRRQERRRAVDCLEDTREHPVVIVPTWKKSASLPAPTAASDEDRPMDVSENTLPVARTLEGWIRDTQHMMTQVIPSLLEESQELRRRADAAEGNATRRQREIEDLQTEVMRLGNEIDRLTKERAILVASVERGITSIARVAAEMLNALKPH